MIVPPVIDQFAWSRIVESLGVGSEGLPIRDFTTERLEPKKAGAGAGHRIGGQA